MEPKIIMDVVDKLMIDEFNGTVTQIRALDVYAQYKIIIKYNLKRHDSRPDSHITVEIEKRTGKTEIYLTKNPGHHYIYLEPMWSEIMKGYVI